MKKSELRELVREIVGGYENRDGKLVPHSDKFDSTKLSDILMRVAKGRPEEGDPVRGSKILDKANPKNVDRILRGEKPMYEEEGEDKFYTKQEVIDYIKNHPPVKYYRIGVGQGISRDLRDDAEAAIELVKKSGVNKYKLSRYGQVIQFTLPFDERHGELVRSMGPLD